MPPRSAVALLGRPKGVQRRLAPPQTVWVAVGRAEWRSKPTITFCWKIKNQQNPPPQKKTNKTSKTAARIETTHKRSLKLIALIATTKKYVENHVHSLRRGIVSPSKRRTWFISIWKPKLIIEKIPPICNQSSGSFSLGVTLRMTSSGKFKERASGERQM